MKRIISVWILLLCAGISEVQTQNDAILAEMVLVHTNKAEKELENQGKVMLVQTTEHVWTKEEVEGTTGLQREFNNHLDSFRSIVCYAAQIYGFYRKISQLTDNMGDPTRQLSRHSVNAPAVALSTRRNRIYRGMISNSVEIVNDIRTACLSDNKVTERGRVEVVFGICPKLRSINRTLQQLTKTVKYTMMDDIWREIDEGAHLVADKYDIMKAAQRQWRQNGRDARP